MQTVLRTHTTTHKRMLLHMALHMESYEQSQGVRLQVPNLASLVALPVGISSPPMSQIKAR